ncbi:MAG: hypothetical protein KGI60_03205 [Patescibacteria group bacterium]|nr:hypothetical protein [Patescibacteria group bacterium]
MKKQYSHLRDRAIALRKQGKTYGDIRGALNVPVPKSTLSLWFTDLELSPRQKASLEKNVKSRIAEGRAKTAIINKQKRQQYFDAIEKRVAHLKDTLRQEDAAKIALSMIYLGEGGKNRNSSLMLGNSDPNIIRLFLKLMRQCYAIDETKFRCTVQCRADQNGKDLEKFWSETTHIPRNQFYKIQIDKRTIGVPTRKPNYKGVCRIDYFSADLYNELTKIAEVLAR